LTVRTLLAQPVRELSLGERMKMELIAALLHSPEVLFLDEPTTGLDPRGRSEVWDTVRALAVGGTTVLLTTHYLDEADRLSDRIAVIDGGRNVTEDSPAGLKRTIGGDRLEVVLRERSDVPAAAEIVAGVGRDSRPQADSETLTVHAAVHDGVGALTEAARTLKDRGIGVEDIGLRRPTLDEVFLRLTGRATADPTLKGART